MVVSRHPAAARRAAPGAAALTERILDRLFPSPRPFAVRLWNGATLPAAGESAFTLVLTHPGALRRMLLPPGDLTIGEAFVRGDFDVEGDLEATVAAGVDAAERQSAVKWLTTALWTLALPRTAVRGSIPPRAKQRGRVHSLERDRAAVQHHYDIGNDFYALWLDRRMVYSCAYFPTGEEDIDAAQEAKLEHICRKLRLRPGERLLDIGCGWGGLVAYAAERYGAHAVGVTLSEPQAAVARERLRAARLDGRAEIRICDYREVRDGPFDKIVSVGMVEHVGRSRLPAYFKAAWALLRPGGLFLNHGITVRGAPTAWRGRGRRQSFIQAHIFPDGELLPIADNIAPAQRVGFEVRDVENLREHYARTLRLWLQRLETGRDRAIELVGEGRYRMWRIYLAACAQGFAVGRTQVFQTLLARPETTGTVGLPWSRADVYR
ncbi:MAG TPA: cyclopropane-fatty-acyl-phospholipid synthase family protein [bacterium]|nr:cyclopropane-fatty-acyl-phospholipid synthase family protein [bacterium]